MALKRLDGTAIDSIDKFVYFGILYNFILSSSENALPSKYAKVWLDGMKKLHKDEQFEIKTRLTTLFDSFFKEFEGKSYDLSLVLIDIVLIDLPLLKALGFNASGFLRLNKVKKVHPSLEAAKCSIAIMESINKQLEELWSLKVVKLFVSGTRKEIKEVKLTRAIKSLVSIDIRYQSKQFIPTVKTRDGFVMIFNSVLIYVKQKDGEHLIRDSSIVGAGGDILSNMLDVGDEETFSGIAVKHMDGKVWLIKTSVYDANIEESILNIDMGYRYTLGRDKHTRIVVTVWKNELEIYKTYKFWPLDLLNESPINLELKPNMYIPIPKEVLKRAGVKKPILSRCEIIDGIHIIYKPNGNVICIDKDGKNVKPFDNITFIVNREDKEEADYIVKYENIKMLGINT